MCHEQFTFYSQLDTPLDIDGFLAQEKGSMDGYLGFSLMMLLTIKDDKIIEKRAHFNEADIMKQLDI